MLKNTWDYQAGQVGYLFWVTEKDQSSLLSSNCGNLCKNAMSHPFSAPRQQDWPMDYLRDISHFGPAFVEAVWQSLAWLQKGCTLLAGT